MKFHTYEEAEAWIKDLIPFGIKPGLKRMEWMMERLDYPHRRLKFIHVAGTNGKGSVCAYLASVLHRAGYDVGSFNSPYITRYTDRIRLNGLDIPDEHVVDIANELYPLAQELAASELGGPTMFEVTTALAIQYFARYAYPDFVVWETGLGGLHDCTNIVTPIVSIITNIGYDHTDILGNTLEKIAEQKAGIIKPGVPVVSTATQPEVVDALARDAKSKNSRLYVLGRDFETFLMEMGIGQLMFDFAGPFRKLTKLSVSLSGLHQMYNASATVMALEVLRQYYAVMIEEEHLLGGLRETKWPGRLEMISEDPPLLLDGAHNPEGAESLASALTTLYPYDKLHFMIGMLATKNHSAYLWHILPIVDTLIVSEPDWRKKMDASELAELVDRLRSERAKPDLTVIVEPDWRAALSRLRQMTGKKDLAVVSGTLYMISDVRSWILYNKTSDKGW